MTQTKKVICLLDEEFEDLELWYPVYRAREEGAEVLYAAPEKGKTYIGKYGVPAVSDLSYGELDASKADGLLVPGGWAPDKIRRDPNVLEFVRQMDAAGKPIGQICHAGWVLVSAKIVRGRKVTSTPGIRDDMENAGPYGWTSPSSSTATSFRPGARRICRHMPRRFAICCSAASKR